MHFGRVGIEEKGPHRRPISQSELFYPCYPGGGGIEFPPNGVDLCCSVIPDKSVCVCVCVCACVSAVIVALASLCYGAVNETGFVARVAREVGGRGLGRTMTL